MNDELIVFLQLCLLKSGHVYFVRGVRSNVKVALVIKGLADGQLKIKPFFHLKSSLIQKMNIPIIATSDDSIRQYYYARNTILVIFILFLNFKFRAQLYNIAISNP